MRFSNRIFSVAAIAIIACSCNNVDFKKTKGGMPYKLFPGSGTKTAGPGSFVKLNITQKLKDSLAYSSYGSFPVYLPVSGSQPYDITELLPTLKQGDSVYAEQLIDSLIAHNPGAAMPPFLKKGDKIITTMKVLDVFKSGPEMQVDEEKEKTAFLKNEDVTVQAYLKKHNINAQKTGTGTYVEMLTPGTGAKVDSGKYVTVMYKGSTFEGKVFDSNIDKTFGHTDPLGLQVGKGGAIKGFDEGLRTLNKGSKARIYIPSSLAYGPQSPSPAIKPFDNLIFEVEVVDVMDKAPASKRMPPVAMDTAAGRGR